MAAQNYEKMFSEMLQLPREWEVGSVDFSCSGKLKEVRVCLRYTSTSGYCRNTGELCSVYDFRPERSWRHLDFMGFPCYLTCRVPRVKNSLGEVVSVAVPWANDDQRHTKKFDDHAINVLKATRNQTKAGELLGVSYEKVNKVMLDGVERGLQRRQLHEDQIPHIGIDEKSYKKGHCYATVISQGSKNRILEVGKGRSSDATEELLEKTFTSTQLEKLRAVCVDMWEPYMKAIKKNALMQSWFTTSFTWSSTLTRALTIPAR